MRLNEIYEELKDRVQFYCVYIQEAHPTDGRQSARNVADGVLHEQPKSIAEREELAQVCVLRLNLKMPMLLAFLAFIVVAPSVGGRGLGAAR